MYFWFKFKAEDKLDFDIGLCHFMNNRDYYKFCDNYYYIYA